MSAPAVSVVVEKDESLVVDATEDIPDLLEQPAFQRVGRAVVVDDVGRPLGVVSLTDMERSLRARQLGAPGGPLINR